MTRAAEKLYTAQPNLSRAMRELENALGITIFRRTSKGIYPTAEGEESSATRAKYWRRSTRLRICTATARKKRRSNSPSRPRASYISGAFTNLSEARHDLGRGDIL